MLNIIAAILVFGFIVLVHEFGHFLLAKLNGITVVEFSIGMGPRLLSHVWGETRYSLKILPFGGSCMMLGEDEEEDAPGAFTKKPVLARIAVIAAGPVFNFILAFLFAMIILSQTGHGNAVILDVMPDSPAMEAGLMAGDKIVKINGRHVLSNQDVSWYLISHPSEPVTLTLRRSETGTWEKGVAYDTFQVELTPAYNEDYQTPMIGVTFSGYTKSESFLELIRYSAHEVHYFVISTFDSLRMLFSRQIAADEAVAGPVRIVTMVGETVESGREAGPQVLLLILSNWILLLSTSLGIMNLLPIPALDGGRLVFLLIELVRGKPIDQEKESMVHMIGLMVLMALMVLILFNDIRSLL